MPAIQDLEAQLDEFDAERRVDVLLQLKSMADQGRVRAAGAARAVNLHAHTFYSFNGYGYSPQRFAWEAYKLGLEVAGIVDFDVLDGAAEMLDAGDVLGLKTVAGIETRVFFPEFAHAEINSPGEPGVYYFMGTGFVDLPPATSQAAATLADMRKRARSRNVAMMGRINAAIGQVQIDYDADVVPLTPKGNATERHLLEAYTRKADAVFADDAEGKAAFWSEVLGSPADEIASLTADVPKFHELIRKKLMKRGGVGYVQPDAGSFPQLDDVLQMVLACGAIPTATWLDGLSEGESDMEAQLKLLMGKGVAALNIIPDRNWNIADPAEKAAKVAKLNEVVASAQDLCLPLVVGTELNKYGQKTVDTFAAPELAPHVAAFLQGARIVWAHTAMRRRGAFGYLGAKADGIFGDDRAAKNTFFAKLGEMAPGDDLGPHVAAARDTLAPALALRVSTALQDA